ncbi:MAG TPA: hypothetical protein VKJ65_01350, partial [Phycisphaerae bacterium]|nr:hypothetical protein [Phycisphaerae bacterium]
ISGKKVAGVLSQTLSAGSRSAAVAGVGLNLNTDPAALGSELGQYASSVSTFVHKKVDPKDALIILLEQVDVFVDHLLSGRWETIHSELKSRDVLYGCIVSLLSADQIITGKAEGISDDGGLKILMPDGVKLISSGSIQTVEGSNIRYNE